MKKYLIMIGNVVGTLAIMFIFTTVMNKLWWNENIIPKSFAERNYDLSTMIAFLLTIAVISLIYKLMGRNLIKTCRFSRLSTNNFIIIGAIGMLMGIFTSCVCNTSFIMNKIPIFGQYLHFVLYGSSNYVSFLIIITIMFAAEEIIFRGIIFNEFYRNVPLMSAIIISTAVYGLLNIFTIQIAVGIYALIAAFFYNLAYVFMNSMYAPIILQVTSIYVISAVIKTGLWENLSKLGDGILITIVVIAIVSMMSLYYLMYRNYKSTGKIEKTAFNM